MSQYYTKKLSKFWGNRSVSIKSFPRYLKKCIKHILTGIPGNASLNASNIPDLISDIESVPQTFP